MYELKNILPQMEIDLPTCMYQIKKCGIDFQENQEKSTPVSAFQFESSILKNLSNQIERICKSEKVISQISFKCLAKSYFLYVC